MLSTTKMKTSRQVFTCTTAEFKRNFNKTKIALQLFTFNNGSEKKTYSLFPQKVSKSVCKVDNK